jgi:hypothetical protein
LWSKYGIEEEKKGKTLKPYEVTFQFNYPSEAKLYVCADSPEQAAEGAKTVIENSEGEYPGLVVTSVTEVKKQENPIFN